MKYTYRPKGVCSAAIEFDIEDNIVRNVHFLGGCDGNLKAISSLVDGMSVDDVCSKLQGITCGFKKTSCSDQFTQALREAVTSASH